MISNIKIEFKDYPSGNWLDWSDYLIDLSGISLNIESDNPGEAGVIVYDKATLYLNYQTGSPVRDYFHPNITATDRYLFRISLLKSDGSYITKFQGVADLLSLSWGEFEEVIKIDVVDKISALSFLTAEQSRQSFKIKDRILSQVPIATGFEFQYHTNTPNFVYLSVFHPNVYDDLTGTVLNVGDVVDIPEVNTGESRLRVVTKVTYMISPNHGKYCNKVEFVPYLDMTDFDVIQYSEGGTPDWNNHTAYDYLLYGIDVRNIVNNELVSLNGINVIKSLYLQAWPNTSVIIIPGTLTYDIPAEYSVRLTTENPFGKSPLDAFVMLVNSFKPNDSIISGCYVYVDANDNLILQSRSSLTSGTQRTLGTTTILNRQKKFSWDKLSDGAEVTLKSWFIDDKTGEYLDAKVILTSKPPGASGFIKPRNPVKKEVISNSKPSSGQDVKEFLVQKANAFAQDILDFYSKRRESYELKLNLDDNVIQWSILDYLTLESKDYFITNLNIDAKKRIVGITLVGVTGYTYDIRNVIIPYNESQGDYSGASQSVVYPGTGGGSYSFTAPLDLSNGVVSLKFADNLKLSSGYLNTIQDIATTSTPTLAQLLLTNQATQTTHSVRADRTLNTSAPLTGGGDLTADRTIGLSYNATNLKLTSNALNTIQDIATTSSPTFNQLTLTSAGTTTTSAVRGDRAINTSAPLTGGGNLTADRTLGLSYNTTNLKLTSNQLNTIQDIATTSSPTFNLPNFTGGIKINGATLSDASRKLTAADIISDGYIQAKTKFQGDQNNHFATTIKDITVLPGGFLEFYPFNFRFDQNQLLYCNRRPTSDGITIQSSGFADLEIDILFSVYAYFVSLHGKPENSFIEVTTSTNILGDVPTYPFVVLHSNNNPVTCKIEVRWSGTGTWNVIYDGTFFNFIMPVNPAGSGYVNGVRWTFSNILNPTYIRWLGWYAPRLRGYGWTVMRGGDTMYGNFVLAAPYKLSIGITNPSEALEVSGNIKSTGWLQGTTAKLTNLTDGYIPYHINDTSGLANSPIYTNGTNIGIGATTPTEKLDVSGNIKASGTLQGTTAKLTNLTDGYIPYHINDTSGLTNSIIYTDGTRVRIGGTLAPAEILNLEGNFRQNGNYSLYNDFTSGWTGSGWRLDYGISELGFSHLELDNLTVRGTMRVYELIINQIRATNGSLFVSSSAKVLSASITPGDPETYTITFEDPEGHNVCPFLVNDIILVQRVRLDSTTIVKQIVCQVTNVAGTTVTANVIYRNGTIYKNDLCVRIGNTSNTARQGSVYLTSDDSNAPYIDIADGVNSWSAWSGANKIKVRIGKLTGITDTFFGALSGYGLYAKSNAYLRGKIYAEQGGWIAGWTIDSSKLVSPTLQDADGYETNFELVADSGALAIGAYLNYNIGVIGTPFFISFGNIKDGAGNYTGYYGISFRQGSSNLFELSNGQTQIAGWNFDASKFYKSTNIELNASTNSVGVNSNRVKMFYTDSSNWGIEGRDTSNNLIFQLGSTNKIAGWTFIPDHIYKLTSGTPTSSPAYGLTISATSTASVVIAYGSNWQRYVKIGYQTSGNWFGLEGTDTSANIVFQLGSTNKISGWNFDTTKLSNGIVSLEASTTMKGLVVDTDKIKIGSFTYTAPTNTYSDITSFLLNGYSGINSGDTFWASYGQTLHTQTSTSNIYMSKVSNTLYHYVNTDGGARATDIDELTYGTIHRMFSDTDRVLNRKIKIEFKLRGIKYEAGTYHNLNGTVNVIYFNSSWGVIKREIIHTFQFLESNVPGVGYASASVIDKTGANAIELFVPGNIPDIYAVYIEFRAGFLIGGVYKRALDFEVSDLKFYGYEGTKTSINEEGLMLYNSDMNYLSFRKNAFEINAYDIKVANYPVVRFLGRYSTSPLYGIKLSDMYLNSSDGKVYMCTSFNSSTPVWSALN